MIQFREANHIASARAAVTVEQVLTRIHQKAWLVIGVQRTQPHETSAADAPGRLPVVGVQVIQQRNLLFQLIERLAIHELSASTGRMRLIALQSKARMVGGREGFHPAPCHNLLVRRRARKNRRQDQRPNVDGSGSRLGSFTSGTDCSRVPDLRADSHACCRQRKL